jgi:hypothetical protein
LIKYSQSSLPATALAGDGWNKEVRQMVIVKVDQPIPVCQTTKVG